MLRMYWYTETLMIMFLSILGTIPDHNGVLSQSRCLGDSDSALPFYYLEEDEGSATRCAL